MLSLKILLKAWKKKTEKKVGFCCLINKPTNTKETGEETIARQFWKLESQCVSVKGIGEPRES